MNADVAKELLRALVPNISAYQALIDDIALLAAYKYDDYEMYGPGHRFFEHLCRWLQQLDEKDRLEALQYVRYQLIFVSRREMQSLARCVYHDVVIPRVLRHIINAERLPLFAYGKAYEMYFADYLRRCLFIGLSDSSLIDFFRRQNGLRQDQVLAVYRASSKHCVEELKKQSGHDRFWAIFLIDDFAGSGHTLLHPKKGNTAATSKMEGSLLRVREHHKELIDSAVTIDVCHYICSDQAYQNITERITVLRQSEPEYANKLTYTAILRIPRTSPIEMPPSDPIVQLCDRYYREEFETSGTRAIGGVKYGFGKAMLPLIMYSNTPNNSIPMLWAEVHGGEKAFHALFRRIDRHKDEGGRQSP